MKETYGDIVRERQRRDERDIQRQSVRETEKTK